MLPPPRVNCVLLFESHVQVVCNALVPTLLSILAARHTGATDVPLGVGASGQLVTGLLGAFLGCVFCLRKSGDPVLVLVCTMPLYALCSLTGFWKALPIRFVIVNAFLACKEVNTSLATGCSGYMHL